MTGSCIIDLLRHGDTGVNGFCGSLDAPLTATGWRQMRKATNVGISWHAILSSPLRRCADFAKALAGQLHLPFALNAGFRELDFGDWEGQTASQLMMKDAEGLAQFWADPWAHTPGNGERLLDFERRVRTAWQDSRDRYRGKRILLITHAGVIRMLLYLSSKLQRSELLGINVPHAYLCTLNPAEQNLLCR